MRRNILIAIILSSATFTHAQDSLYIQKSDTGIAQKHVSENNIRYFHFLNPKYQTKALQNIESVQGPELTISEYPTNELTSNWFINAAGGVSTFLGNPLGCEDLFARIRPILHLSVGKWFSPTAGGRIAFQGFDLKSHLIECQNYYHIHADFLWNITNAFQKNNQEKAIWQFIPFAGTGIIQNNATHQHMFTLNYGILNHLPLNRYLSLSLELGGLTTFGNFDGAGKGNKFSDHLFHLSAGISITLGNKGWNFQRNNINYFLSQNHTLSEINRQLKIENVQNRQIVAQMRKILEIEGLLSRFQDELAEVGLALDDSVSANHSFYYPKNDYSGLNSLRQRLSATGQNIAENNPPITQSDTLTNTQDSLSYELLSNTQQSDRNFIADMMKRKICIGSPILFFFRCNTSTLTDSSQLANIDEIARICRKYDLLLKVTGYADSATGNVTGNSVLSKQRAYYIASELKKRSIPDAAIELVGKGGIDTYSPDKVNRCVKIEIHLKH